MKHLNRVTAVALYASIAFVVSGHCAQAQTHPESNGAYLARSADCVACHSVPGGKPFAGGFKMGTPFGAIYSTNITPDKATGIGAYTLADFDRAVRKGVAKDGHYLYPAMPYPSYARISDGDLAALYDYFMREVTPVRQQNRPGEIKWPLNARWPLAIWDVLFTDMSPYVTDHSHDAQWNRGAYLVEGLGHCGACHTPRGLGFEEKALDDSSHQFLAGSTLDGWTASDLRGDSASGLGRWSAADIVAFLKEGGNSHASVFGSMIEAYNNSTQFMSDADLHAIASYLKSLPPAHPDAPAYVYDDATLQTLRRGDIHDPGAEIFRTQCASCHGIDGKGFGDRLPSLAGNPNVLTDDPSSIVNIVLNGAQRVVRQGMPDTYRMAPFRLQLNDREIAEVATWIRHSWGNRAGAVDEDAVAKLRAQTDMSSDQVIILRMK